VIAHHTFKQDRSTVLRLLDSVEQRLAVDLFSNNGCEMAMLDFSGRAE